MTHIQRERETSRGGTPSCSNVKFNNSGVRVERSERRGFDFQFFRVVTLKRGRIDSEDKIFCC